MVEKGRAAASLPAAKSTVFAAAQIWAICIEMRQLLAKALCYKKRTAEGQPPPDGPDPRQQTRC